MSRVKAMTDVKKECNRTYATNTINKQTGIPDACNGVELNATLPVRAAIDEQISALSIGISNFREAGPEFAPGNAIAAEYIFNMITRARLRSEGSGGTSYSGDNLVSVNGPAMKHLVSVPRRGDPTGLFEAYDATSNSLARRRSNWSSDWSRELPNEFSRRRSNSPSMERKRLTKSLVLQEIDSQIADAAKQAGRLLVVLYISTYQTVKGDSWYLFASDSDAAQADSLLSYQEVFGRYERLLAEDRDKSVLVVFDGVFTGYASASFLRSKLIKSNERFAFLHSTSIGAYSWFWRPDSRTSITYGRTPTEQRPARVSTYLVNLHRQSLMSPLPVALGQTLKTCEETDVDSDHVPKIDSIRWLSTAIKTTQSRHAAINSSHPILIDLTLPRTEPNEVFGVSIYCPAPGDVHESEI